MIYGERSNGKSYQVKHKKAVEKYLKTGKRFILMRRLREEITSEKIEQYFQDVDVAKLTNGKYNCITLYRKNLYLSVYDNDGQEGFFVPSSAFRDLSKDQQNRITLVQVI